MGSLYPGLISKRPELLNRLAKRGVTYYTDPASKYGGVYSPKERTVTIQPGMPVAVAGHEIVHADLDISPINTARFLLDKGYRAAKASDLVIGGRTASGWALRLYLLAAGGNINERVAKASYQGEIFAMGAGGAGAYPDLPVDYYDANRLFGGSFDK
jgi:hypothetical protein